MIGILAGFTSAEVIARLGGSGLPFAPVGRPEDMFDDLHLLASGGFEDMELRDGGLTQLPTVPIVFGQGDRRVGSSSRIARLSFVEMNLPEGSH